MVTGDSTNSSHSFDLPRCLHRLIVAAIGISRGNLANIERGNVKPTPMFINCVSLMFHIDKNWLLDDDNDDLSALNASTNMMSLIMDRYELLNDNYKRFVEKQIDDLLSMQKQSEDSVSDIL